MEMLIIKLITNLFEPLFFKLNNGLIWTEQLLFKEHTAVSTGLPSYVYARCLGEPKKKLVNHSPPARDLQTRQTIQTFPSSQVGFLRR